MNQSEITQVLKNWIDQATSTFGTLRDDVDPAEWVAKNFLLWWRQEVESNLADAESAARSVRSELLRLKNVNQLDEALHELTHCQDALLNLRETLGHD